MRRQNQHDNQRPRTTNWWKKTFVYVVSLQWVDWSKRAIGLAGFLVLFFPFIVPWLPEWVDAGQIYETLNNIAEIQT